MRRIVAAALLGIAIVAPARGADLLLGTGENLSWNTTTQPTSPTFNVSVQNPGGAVTDPVLIWQLGLAIAPEAGAVGTLSFATFGPPVNYLLAGDSTGIVSAVANPPVQLFVNDAALLGSNGVVVPSAGANLLALTFSAGSGARGTFDIVTYGDPSLGSAWVSGTTQNTLAFGNVPFPATFPGPPVVLGTVTLTQSTVPEPHSVVLLFWGAGALLLCGLVRNRTARLVA
jgi:hypothetical protein